MRHASVLRLLLSSAVALLAVLPVFSCSSTSATACSAASCEGCCVEGTCLAPEDQIFSLCGSRGAACQACAPGEVCQSGVCGEGTGATSRCGRTGQTCCEGDRCYGSLQCVDGRCTGSDVGDCGGVGQTCCAGTGAGCAPGLFCAAGYCVRDTTGGGGGGSPAVGGPCTDNGQCVGNLCFQEVAPGAAEGCSGGCWPKGYCSQDCAAAGCPSGSSCMDTTDQLDPNAPKQGVCLQDCVFDGAGGGCQPGYVCDKGYAEDNPNKANCINACHDASDCFQGPSQVRCERGFCCGRTGYRCCYGEGSTGTCPYPGASSGEPSQCVNGYCQALPI